MLGWINEHLGSIIVAFLGAGAWLFERRKRIAQAKVIEGDANSSMQSMYEKFVKDYDDKFQEMKKEVDELKRELEECKDKYFNAA